MTRDQIISRIETFAAAQGIAPATVTSRAVGNSRLYRRMRQGGDCTTEVAARIVRYIEDNSSAPSAASTPEVL
jgi:hypothetical protein